MNGTLTATVRDANAGSTLLGGTFAMGAGSTIRARNGITISGGSIQAATLSTGDSTATFTRGPIALDSGTFTTDAAGNVIPATVTVDTLTTSNPFMIGSAGGAISISSGGAVRVNTAVNSSSGGNAGGSFTIGPSTVYGVAPAGGVPAGPYQPPTSITIPVPNTAGSIAATAGQTTVPNAGPITLTTGGIIAFYTPGTTTLAAPVTFTGNTSLTAEGASNTQFNGGYYDLSLSLRTQQVNLANIANVNNFTSSGTAGTFTAASFTTTGNQTYNNELSLGNVVTLTSTGGYLQFAKISNATPQSLTLNALGGVIFTQSVGSTTSPLASLDVINGTNTTFRSTGTVDVTTTDNQRYTGDAAFNTASTTLTSQGGAGVAASSINIGSISGTGSALTVVAASSVVGSAGPSSFNGSLTFNLGAGRLTLSAPVGAASLTRNGSGETLLNGGIVTTSGGQFYGGNALTPGTVILGANTTLQSTNGGAIRFFGALDSDERNATTSNAWTLTLLTNGAATFEGRVGGSFALGQLTVGNATTYNLGSTVFNVLSSSPTVSTISVGTTINGQQTYNNAVRLLRDATLQSAAGTGAASGGDITFNSTVNTSGATPRTLTVNTWARSISTEGLATAAAGRIGHGPGNRVRRWAGAFQHDAAHHPADGHDRRGGDHH